MRLKSYFASSVDEAIERARLELGPEAMLLNSRRVAPNQPNAGSFEVVFGITGEALRKPAHKPAAPLPARPNIALNNIQQVAEASQPVSSAVKSLNAVVSEPVANKVSKRHRRKKGALGGITTPSSARSTPMQLPPLAAELAELRKQIQAVQSSINRNLTVSTNATISQPATYQKLLEFDFSDRAAKTLADGSGGSASALLSEINNRFEVSPRLGKESGDRRVVMFVGPPGAGKTSTVAKLAIKFGIQRRLPVQLLSLDTMRVGGSEQLAEYARISGVEFRALYSTVALGEVLDECAPDKLVLIDTPGYAPAEMDEAEENAYFLRKHPEVEVHLVLPASLRASALHRFSERFAVFSPTKLVFTHLDEVDTFGPLLEHAMLTKLPVSFLTDGQNIPNDIEEASKKRLTEGLFSPTSIFIEAAAVSAA